MSPAELVVELYEIFYDSSFVLRPICFVVHMVCLCRFVLLYMCFSAHRRTSH